MPKDDAATAPKGDFRPLTFLKGQHPYPC